MTSEMAKKYEDYKKCKNIIIDYDEILILYPDYFKTKNELEQLKFISKEEKDEYFENHYKKSRLYKKLSFLAMTEDEIYSFMKHNMELKYSQLSLLFKETVASAIQLCELIDYIGHYPATCPVPKEEEKNPSMEALLEQYDIMVRYYLVDDFDKMQITSDDVVRIIETLKSRLAYIDTVLKITYNNEWLLTRELSEANIVELTNQAIIDVKSFPLSNYQTENKSRREEGKMYLRRQYGDSII